MTKSDFYYFIKFPAGDFKHLELVKILSEVSEVLEKHGITEGISGDLCLHSEVNVYEES